MDFLTFENERQSAEIRAAERNYAFLTSPIGKLKRSLAGGTDASEQEENEASTSPEGWGLCGCKQMSKTKYFLTVKRLDDASAAPTDRSSISVSSSAQRSTPMTTPSNHPRLFPLSSAKFLLNLYPIAPNEPALGLDLPAPPPVALACARASCMLRKRIPLGEW